MAFELIEASAGTGKTFSITSRFILLLVDLTLQVGQILVLTFTEAATAELRERIRLRIREVRDVLESGRLDAMEDIGLRTGLQAVLTGPEEHTQAVKRLTNALIAFDEASIFTIHGFCRRVLSEQAFASGADFTAEVLTDDLPLLEEVVADFARSHLGTLSVEEYGWCVEHSVFFDGASESDWRMSGRVMTSERLKTLHTIVSSPFIRLVPEGMTVEEARKQRDPAGLALAVTYELVTFVRAGLTRRKLEAGIISFGDMLLNVHTALTGPGGPRLAEALRASFRAALIDEFQDTDPLQYDIIRRIYQDSDAPVVFVGDPKQAIYSFRGGDIFTYFSATANIPQERRKTLDINYRSARDLVAAVSAIFTFTGNTMPFADGGRTGFPVVTAHHPAGKEARELPAAPARAALHWFLLPEPSADRKGAAYGWTKSAVEPVVIQAVVREIAELVGPAPTVQGVLSHGDIAILVRTNVQAAKCQQALVDAGIPCIVRSAGSVFGSVSARELLFLLRAVVAPGNDGSVSTALLTSSLGYTAAELAALKQDTAAYGAIAERLVRLRKVWEGSQHGFMRMATALLSEGGLASGGKPVAEHILVFADAERRLTDMLHLIELLHQESILHPGPDHLTHWLERQIADLTMENEEASIRLETDAQRVQIVTVHSSKGLEYPVVFCPFTYEGCDVKLSKKGIVFCHDERDMAAIGRGEIPVLTADCGSPERMQHHMRRQHEARSEDVRLLYVALTRARQRCYVSWGLVNNMEDAALSYLLLEKADRAVLKGLGHAGVIAPVQRMIRASHGAMSSSQVRVTSRPPAVQHGDGEMHDGTSLRARTFDRLMVPASWQYTSYTSLTSEWVRSGKDTDGAVELPAMAPVAGDSIFAFPSGARTGKVWHRLFEVLDFGATDEQTACAVEKILKRNSFDITLVPAVQAMVRAVLARPLGPAQFRLRSVGRHSCVRELDFVFSCRHYATADVRAALARSGSGAHPAFIRAAGGLHDRDVRGFMIGTIDLLVGHEGRFYLIDYKSNNLGPTPEHYGERGMLDAMAREHYYLQYLIYTVAVHRYLRTRVPGYGYERHFGGVFYLFLRGMAAGTGQGVFFDRPALSLVNALESRLLAGEGS